MKPTTTIPALPLAALLLAACNAPNRQYTADMAPDSTATATIANVPGDSLSDGSLSSWGTITTSNSVEVCSRITEQIVACRLTEGQRVTKGEVLIQLDRSRMDDNIRVAEAELEKCANKYKTILLGLGYKLDELDCVPQGIQRDAHINSGYDAARAQLESLRHQLQYCQITAPFTGTVSKVNTSLYATAQAGVPLFEVIDTKDLLVTFDILESELYKYDIGTHVTASLVAYRNEPHDAVVTSVSPVIDSNGMARIKARLTPHPHLMPGQTAIITVNN